MSFSLAPLSDSTNSVGAPIHTVIGTERAEKMVPEFKLLIMNYGPGQE